MIDDVVFSFVIVLIVIFAAGIVVLLANGAEIEEYRKRVDSAIDRAEIEEYRKRADSGEAINFCRFSEYGCPYPAIVRVKLTRGCVCYPDDREQWLCEHHLRKSEPLGELEIVEVVLLTNGAEIGEYRKRVDSAIGGLRIAGRKDE